MRALRTQCRLSRPRPRLSGQLSRANASWFYRSFTPRHGSGRHVQYAQICTRYFHGKTSTQANPVASNGCLGLHPESNPLDSVRQHLALSLARITQRDPAQVLPAITFAKSIEHGDLSVVVPVLREKGSSSDVTALARDLADQFCNDPVFDPPTINGVSLQFHVRPTILLGVVLPRIQKERGNYGRNQHHGLRDTAAQSDPGSSGLPSHSSKKRIIVEFSSPNIAKPFHAGHLRSTIIGAFLANLYEGAGWDVIRMNYLGDWGKQYGLLALAYERYGDEELLKRDPIQHLFQLYVKINADSEAEQAKIAGLKEGATPESSEAASELEANSLDARARGYFAQMTARDPEAMAQWQRFRDMSIETYKDTYKRLGIRFDVYSGESQVSEEAMESLTARMKEDGVAKPSNGAEDGGLVVNFKEAGFEGGKKLGSAVVKRKDGTFLYLTRDVAELLERKKKYNFDEAIYVVSLEQDQHVAQLFALASRYGGEFGKQIAKTCKHINFGLVLGMSTRKGTVRFLNEILDEARDRMLVEMKAHPDNFKEITDPETTADILGMSAVMVADLKGKRRNNYKFDIDAMTRLTGDTGPSLQYAHARICGIQRRVGLQDSDLLHDVDWSLLENEPLAVDLVRLLAQYPDTIQQVLKTLEPVNVITYLFRVATAVGAVYSKLRVEGASKEDMKARMALYDAARQVLANGMRVLGLTPLERM